MNKVDKHFSEPLVSDFHFSSSGGSSAGFDSSPLLRPHAARGESMTSLNDSNVAGYTFHK